MLLELRLIIVKKAEKEGIDKLFYLSVFQVERKYVRQGIGRKMLCTLKEKLKNSILYLDASSYGDIPNEKLIEFYESMGFEIVKEGKGKERRFSTMLCINK